MEQFPVPQFIDVEDKIIGPITVRQFVLMVVAALIAFILYRSLSLLAFGISVALDVGIFATLAFAKINGRPIHFFFVNLIQTYQRPNIRVWNKEVYVRDIKEVKSEIKEFAPKRAVKESVSHSRLDDLSLVVNTGGSYEATNEYELNE
jgi:hypothetical protein